ncbi:Uu.00g060560.m01.CDS01 [Anthostomella pinea]|uniref:Nucleolar complex-associated protein 3 n=1 Tax=Anthostomella pinea TaxID=933095 RepID=A0AAI8YK23_9PEZI|nr:Uu.00g060560.m01.CDS01 [Anthostomella pinea]
MSSSRPSKKRKLTPPQSDDEGSSHKTGAKVQKAFFKNASTWNLEEQYEDKARKGKKSKEKENTRLPLKLPGGRVQPFAAPVVDDVKDVESDDDWLEGEELSADEAGEEPVEAQPEIPEYQQIKEAKEELAKIASLLNEDPGENAGAFKALGKIGASKIPTIVMLTLATQLSVYKDLIPGYRIRPVAEDNSKEKLSKDVRRLRTYEDSLVSGYQAYVRELTKYTKAGKRQDSGMASDIAGVAMTCACTLLTSVPHFNFRSELIKILVRKCSSRRVDNDFNKCLQAFQTLFQEDQEGRPSMEAASLLSKMMKAKEYQVDESVVNLFLHLRLLSDFSGKGSKDTVDRDDDGLNRKKPKAKKVFRNKKERKEMKEQRALDKDMAHADALVSSEERDRMQNDTLKLVFATYFRILKLRVPHLMGAVLEGLSKYAANINQDFFGDLLEALKDLIRHSDADQAADEAAEADDDDTPLRNTTREALLCTVTAFTLLAGQDAHNSRADLHLDLSFFTTHLWQTLFPLALHPDLELGARSLHLPDPDAPQASTAVKARSDNKVNLQTTTVLLIRCLTAILLPPFNVRSVPPLRLAAFAKQLMGASLHVPEKSAQAILALLADVGSTHGRKIAALWNTEERKGDGTYNPVSESVEGSNPYAATVWEGEILRRHYCPKVREGVRVVQKHLEQR